MKPLPALLLLAACSRELAPPSMSTTSSLAYRPATTSLAREASATAASHTTPWADSSTRGNTTFYSRGRVVTTVEVITDSIWSLGPQVTLGLPSGPFNLPPDSLCTLGYTATTVTVTDARVLRDLQRIRECGARAFVQIRRAKLKDSLGHLSVQAARAELDRWPWDGNALCSRVRDSTILAFYIGDDVLADEWGPASTATRFARWDSIAGEVRSHCPEAAVTIRAMATQLEARAKWQWLTTAWAQYPGPRPIWGAPEPFFAKQVASAKRQGLGLVTGVNLLNGSCGPATRRWCLADIPGSTLPGTQPEFYQLSVAELMYYKTLALSDPYVCASVDWSWGPNFRSDFHERPEIRSAMKVLSVVAAKRPLASCVPR